MKKLNFQSIKSRLLLSFSAMALLIIVVVLLTLFQVANIMQLGNSLLENKQPSRMCLETLKSGVNNSNVMLQSYLLSGEPEYRNKNESIWKNQIIPVQDSLNALKENWKNASHLIALEKINRLAERIRTAQNQVFDQAKFVDNKPKVNIFNFEAIENDTVFEYSALQSWIDDQLNQPVDNNEDLFFAKLAGISQEYNQLSDDLFKSIELDAEELGQEIFTTRDRFVLIESLIVILAIIICFLLFRFVLKTVLKSINKVNDTVKVLGEGNIPEVYQNTNDELNKILLEINHLSNNLKNVQKFALEVGKGNFDNDISVFNNEGDIGSSLAEMRDSLKTVSEEAVIRNWSNKGFTEFGDILRKYSDNLDILCDHVITYMVKYLNANQGSIFIIDEDTEGSKRLELRSTYAYDRKKYINKIIEPGQGMVGQVYLEKESIYLKEIPENYVTITSGLGQAMPKSIFIVPLQLNKEVFGVIEIGSFKNLKEYEREFVEKISENIASSIQAVKVNEKTRKLLDESQDMTEQMRSQEEEMRQNMEELQATQEEMERSQMENQDRILALEKSGMSYIEFSPQGEILYADKVFLQLFEYQDIDLIKGKHHRIFVSKEYGASEEYSKFWQDLAEGKMKEGVFERYTKNNTPIFIKGTYVDVRNKRGEIFKIIKFATDVTSTIKKTEALKKEKEAILLEMQTLQARLENNYNSSPLEGSSSIQELKIWKQTLDKELAEKLRTTESHLKKALAEQKKKLGL